MIIQLLKIIYAELKHLFLGWWADGGHMTRSLLDENDCIDTHSWQQTEHNTEFNLCFNPCYTEKNVLSLWQHRLMFTKQLWQTCYVLKESGIYGCIHPISNAETICNAISQVWWWGVRWEVGGIILQSVEVINHSICMFSPLLEMLHGFQVCTRACPEWQSHTHKWNIMNVSGEYKKENLKSVDNLKSCRW